MCAHQISVNDGGKENSDINESYRASLNDENKKNAKMVFVDDDTVLEMDEKSPSPILLDSNYFSTIPEYDVGLLVDEKITNQMKEEKSKAKKRKTKRYYKQQLELIESYKKDDKFMQKFVENDEASYEDEDEPKNFDHVLTNATILVNVVLLIGKIVAAVLSGSLVVISSVIDSAMDLTTGAVIFFTSRAIKRRDITKYPRGRTRLEPLALIVISVIMGAANVQVIVKSIEDLISNTVDPNVKLPTLIIMIATVVIKFILMIVCYIYPSSNAKVLAQDHRNDCISNTTAAVCGYLATNYWVYLDPIAAIIVSFYIIGTWMKTGFTHVAILSGKTAKSDVINRIVKICMDHEPKVDLIDTVLAYHFGLKYLVEVHVVLDKDVSLRESHDISEPLQRKIEHLPFVERAFVHVDYDTEHKPSYEHKLV